MNSKLPKKSVISCAKRKPIEVINIKCCQSKTNIEQQQIVKKWKKIKQHNREFVQYSSTQKRENVVHEY